MALTRAQLIVGDSSQGFVLPGQVQGVKEGNGINILGDGTIEVDSQTIVGVMKLGQTAAQAAAAFNKYIWPTGVVAADIGRQLTVTGVDGSGNAILEWQDSDGIDWTQRGQIIAATGAGETSDTLVNIGSARSFLMSRVDDAGNLSGLAYSDVITSAMKVPAGDQTQRPAVSVAGEMRFNTSQNKLEVWDGLEWQTVASEDPADGGYVVQLKPTSATETDIAVIPSGTTVQRITSPSPAGGYFRYNRTVNKLEFYNGVTWEEVTSGIPGPGGSTFVTQTIPVTGTASAVLPPGSTAQRQTSPAPVAGYLRYNTDPNAAMGTQGTLEYWDGVNWITTAATVAPGGFVPQTSTTGAAVVPSGNTGARPGAPLGGYFRYNTDQNYLEFYNAATTTWELLAPAGGGVHSFVQAGTPTAFNEGDLWYDTALQRESVWNGAAWVQPGVTQTGPTGAAQIPVGNQAARPVPLAAGQFRLNSTTGKLEVYTGTAWEQVASADPTTGTFVAQTVPTTGTASAVIPTGNTAGRQTAPAPVQGYTRFNTDTTLMEVFDGTIWVPIGAPPNAGLGLDLSGVVPNQILKVSIPQQSTPPTPGTLALESISGSLYWDDFKSQLYIRYNNGGTPAWVQAAPSAGSIGITSVNASGGTTGLTFSGGPITSFGTLTMAGTLGIANGGTGGTTQPTAINNLLPAQGVGNANKFLKTDGTNVSWASAGGTGGAPLATAAWAGPTGVIISSTNVSSVTLVGAGTYQVNYTVSLPSASYCAAGNAGGTIGDRDAIFTILSASISTTSIQVQTANAGAAVLFNYAYNSLIVVG